MAFEQAPVVISLDVAADYSAKQHFGMDIDTSGDIVLISAAGQRPAGILVGDPNTAGQAGRLQISGIAKVVAGGSIPRGDSVAFDSSGKAKTAVKATVDTTTSDAAEAVKGSYVFGIALSAADDLDVIPVLLQFSGAIPTTAL